MESRENIKDLIGYGAQARDNAMRAITAAKNGAFDQADFHIKEANQALHQGHKVQSEFIEGYVQTDDTVRLTHAQDHIMTASAIKDLAVEIVYLHKHK